MIVTYVSVCRCASIWYNYIYIYICVCACYRKLWIPMVWYGMVCVCFVAGGAMKESYTTLAQEENPEGHEEEPRRVPKIGGIDHD